MLLNILQCTKRSPPSPPKELAQNVNSASVEKTWFNLMWGTIKYWTSVQNSEPILQINIRIWDDLPPKFMPLNSKLWIKEENQKEKKSSYEYVKIISINIIALVQRSFLQGQKEITVGSIVLIVRKDNY